MNDLVFPAESLAQLRKDLLAHSPDEAAGILFAGQSVRNGKTRLLVRELFLVPRSAYEVQESYRLSVSARFIAPLLKRARAEGWSLVMVHTHPFSDGAVDYSTVDDEGERLLFPTVFGRAPDRAHGSLVLGVHGHNSRLWKRSAGPSEPTSRVIECGRNVRFRSGDSAVASHPESVVDERSIRAFGAEGQATLSAMRFAVVGVGGTGSIVAQQLAHLGAQRILLVDPDRVEATNLNRLVGANKSAVGQTKVEVARRHIAGIRSSIETEAIVGDVLKATDAARVLESDFMFCCTDSHGSRAVLNQLAYQYMIPTVDMGVRIQTVQGRVTDIAGRVQMLGPGLPCLVCNGFLDSEQVRRDLLTDEARARDQYISGAIEPQPAVISLNGTVASMAVTMMLAAVTGMPSAARHQILIGTRGMVRPVDSVAEPGCVICSVRGALGRGDTWPMPGRPC